MSYACGLEIFLALALAGLFQRAVSALRGDAPILAQIEAWEQAQADVEPAVARHWGCATNSARCNAQTEAETDIPF